MTPAARGAATAVATVLAIAACSPAEPSTGDAASGAGRSLAANASCAAGAGSALPPDSGALLGVSIDWTRDTLADYTSRLGRAPSVAVTFTRIPMSDQDRTNVAAAAAQAAAQGSRLLLTLEPDRGLGKVTDDAVADLVEVLDETNAVGVPVVVRYGHEMNGSWYAWGQQPAGYVRSFRKVAAAVHAGAPGSSMMWAPSYGGGYPFTGGAHAARPGSRAAKALDTNRDRELDGRDDPYAPYYPGDEAVDWVGMSLYHWGTEHPWGDNEVPSPGKLVAQLRGTYHRDGVDERGVPDFYGVYGGKHAKPVAVTETAALYAPGNGGAKERTIKQAWWRQAFAPDLLATLPRLKLVSWFEWAKYEPEIKGTVDWTVTSTPAMSRAFAADLPSWVVNAPDAAACPG